MAEPGKKRLICKRIAPPGGLLPLLDLSHLRLP
jgi:hypothetical protein